MFNEPRNWKWMIPSALTVIFLIMWGETTSWGAWSNIWLGLTIICGLAGVMNLLLYVYAHVTQAIIDTQTAEFNTPEVRMFEAARGMHPDAVRYLLTQRRTLWRLRYVPASELVDWVLDEAPSVHVGFVEFVLDYSTELAVMPKSMLSQGSKHFDPDGLISDYEQYDMLILLMQQKLYCTAAFGNQAPKWIAPWRPDLLRRRMGVDEGMMNEAAEEAVLIPTEVRAAGWKDRLSTASGIPLSAQGSAQDPINAAMDGLEQTSWMRKAMRVSRR